MRLNFLCACIRLLIHCLGRVDLFLWIFDESLLVISFDRGRCFWYWLRLAARQGLRRTCRPANCRNRQRDAAFVFYHGLVMGLRRGDSVCLVGAKLVPPERVLRWDKRSSYRRRHVRPWRLSALPSLALQGTVAYPAMLAVQIILTMLRKNWKDRALRLAINERAGPGSQASAAALRSLF